jgi:hypothetical protein
LSASTSAFTLPNACWGSHRVCQLTSSLRLLPPASFSRLRGWNFYSIKKPGDLGWQRIAIAAEAIEP